MKSEHTAKEFYDLALSYQANKDYNKMAETCKELLIKYPYSAEAALVLNELPISWNSDEKTACYKKKMRGFGCLGALIGLLLALAILVFADHFGGEFGGIILVAFAFILFPLIGAVIGGVIQQLKK